ncbi:hypothetical protein OHT76_37685 [Streptomyces sp. NBC_00287]|uniref:hypothetical protein n=1 Tax=Streptomyces sp. NBC_00287 TaxID=2975702 RepID=UPI002E2CB347|nr:hypothetical protein [Streptomyces sp. NBC_00287]
MSLVLVIAVIVGVLIVLAAVGFEPAEDCLGALGDMLFSCLTWVLFIAAVLWLLNSCTS